MQEAEREYYNPEYHKPLTDNTRRCHDCGKVTHDYRCPKCWAKHRSKYRDNCVGWGDA